MCAMLDPTELLDRIASVQNKRMGVIPPVGDARGSGARGSSFVFEASRTSDRN